MLLTARGLAVTIGDRLLLNGIDVDVAPGEAIAVVGPSGSGKTTLLAALGGLLEPSSGSVTAYAGDGSEIPARETVTWILQTANVLADRTVLDNVAIGGFADGRTRADCLKAGMPCLDAMGIADRAHDPVRTLSGGQVQRVVAARALLSRRPVILADEPTGNLDQASTQEFMEVMLAAIANPPDATADASHHSHRRALVLATHDLSVAQQCDRVLRLDQGLVR